MNAAEVLFYIKRYIWFPVVFIIAGVLLPFPLFSMHGGPAWLLLMASVPCMLIYSIVKVLRAPKGFKKNYILLHSLCFIGYLLLALLATFVVEGVVTEKF